MQKMASPLTFLPKLAFYHKATKKKKKTTHCLLFQKSTHSREPLPTIYSKYSLTTQCTQQTSSIQNLLKFDFPPVALTFTAECYNRRSPYVLNLTHFRSYFYKAKWSKFSQLSHQVCYFCARLWTDAVGKWNALKIFKYTKYCAAKKQVRHLGSVTRNNKPLSKPVQ